MRREGQEVQSFDRFLSEKDIEVLGSDNSLTAKLDCLATRCLKVQLVLPICQRRARTEQSSVLPKLSASLPAANRSCTPWWWISKNSSSERRRTSIAKRRWSTTSHCNQMVKLGSGKRLTRTIHPQTLNP